MNATPSPAPSEPGPLPSGTVTFALTDIEGSTERWERDRVAMDDALRRHDALIRAAVAANSGHVFKTVGDAFCVAFRRPEDAVVAMLEVQRRLAAENFSAVGGIRVRAAIHTGTAYERNGDYFGPVVNRVARILAVGNGGQVLLSAATADLVQGTLPVEASLGDLGNHRLKDLARPEHIYQLLSPESPRAFPPLRSLDAHANNLPAILTSFVGRAAEIAEITELLAANRLVTLVGSGGTGKTRTSLQVAADSLDSWRDGVWFIELAPLANGKYIPRTVARALGLTLTTGGNALDKLARALGPKHALLILDNCEHLLESAAEVASSLLHRCPHVKLLVSSRRRLGIAGEEIYALPSLDVPRAEKAAGLRAHEAMRSAAIQLFVERARTVNKQFELTDDNAATVSDICRHLDGIPLAIELAASRIRMLAPRQLLERLDARFGLLTDGSRDVLPRQQTLLATIDWSHDLLDARERALFRRLGIFVNGFALEGAVAVGSGLELAESDVFEVLSSLLDQSLVFTEPHGERLRYRLLESTLVYASEKLAEAGEHDVIAARHLRYLRDLFARVWVSYQRSASVSDLTSALKTELEDVRAALAGALTRSDVIAGGQLTVNLGRGWSFIGLDSEERMWSERFLSVLPRDQHALLARLRAQLSSNFLEYGHNVRAMELAEQAVELARASGDDETLAWALKESAGAAIEFGRLEDAEAHLTEAGAIQGVEAFLRLRLLRLRGLLTEARGDHEAAIATFDQVIKEARLRNDYVVEQRASRHVAVSEYHRGRTENALAIAREMLSKLRTGADTEELARWLRYFAVFLAARDNLSEAAAAAREATELFALQGFESANVTAAFEVLALVYALQGNLARAAALEGYSQVAFRREPFQRDTAATETHERLIVILRDGLAPDELEQLLAQGAGFMPEEALAFALNDG